MREGLLNEVASRPGGEDEQKLVRQREHVPGPRGEADQGWSVMGRWGGMSRAGEVLWGLKTRKDLGVPWAAAAGTLCIDPIDPANWAPGRGLAHPQ